MKTSIPRSPFFSYLLLFCVLGLPTLLSGQTCVGNVTLTTQAAVNSFNCSVVTGSLIIDGTGITSLSSLSSLNSVGLDLIIQNTGLSNLSGLSNLGSVGRALRIRSNNSLANVDALSGLGTVGGELEIGFNPVLKNINGLSSVGPTVGSVFITANFDLTNLDGLSSLRTSTGSFFSINFNDELTNINGLSSLQQIGGFLTFSGNKKLANLNGLSSLTTVPGVLTINDNDKLTNVGGLINLSYAGVLRVFDNAELPNLDGFGSLGSLPGGLEIYNNAKLNSFCGLWYVCSRGPISPFTVYGNLANPTQAAIVSGGACANCPAPVARCKNFTVSLDANGAASISVADVDNGSTVPCGLQGSSVVPNSFSCANRGPNTVNLTLTDTKGRSASCTATVTVTDITKPTASCQNITVYLDGTGNAGITPGDIDNGSSDNCGIVSSNVSPNSFGCNDVSLPIQTGDLFISEYVEGSSLNKALELFNGTGAAIDLAAGGYKIEVYFNGNSSPGTTVNLAGTVANGDVFVLADDGAAAGILAVADQTTPSNLWNGDDAIVLKKGNVILDIFGEIGADPGSEWNVGGNETQNHTLRRKGSVTAGNTVNGAGFPSLGTEWDEFGNDNISNLGSHSLTTTGGVTVTLTVFDASGNFNTCNSVVTVIDSTSPVVNCQNVTVYLDNGGMAQIHTGDVVVSASDNCGVVSAQIDRNTFYCANVYGPADAPELFISEYLEGSGNNKCIEIYNGTGASIDLGAAGYTVEIYFNGSSNPGTTVNLTGTLADGATHVLCQNQADAAILAKADQSSGSSFFNGNDAVVLRRGPVILDIFGVIGDNPGSAGWLANSGTTSTQNQTLRREPFIDYGVSKNPTGTGPNAFTTLGWQWVAYPQDNHADLGLHSPAAAPPNYVIATALDPSGNDGFCRSEITVRDTVRPVLQCPPTIDTICDISEAPPYPDFYAFVAGGGIGTDNCAIDPRTFTMTNQTQLSPCPGEAYTRTYFVEDINGNSSRCVQRIEVQPCAAIGDRVFEDLNEDGLQDPNEPGVGGVIVSLFEVNSGFLAKDTTDANGYYLFDSLCPKTYYLRFGNLPQYYVFSPNEVGSNDTIDSDADVNGHTVLITLTPRERDLTWDAGIYEPKGAIGDRVWDDLNQNGQQNPGEPGVGGVGVRLFDCSGNQLASTTTDQNGNYLFTDVLAGSYTVQFDLPAGYVFSPKNNAGAIEDSDADPQTGRTVCINLPSGQTQLSWDAGIYQAKSSIGDYVWCDENGNDCQDPGEQPLRNVTITLYDATGAVVAGTTSDAYGRYRFDNLNGGAYQLGFSNLPAGFIFSAKEACSDSTRDSDVNPATGMTDLFHLPGGIHDDSRDAGIRAPGQSIGNFVWNDYNRNGIQDAGEPGVQGVTVFLYNANNQPVNFTATDAQGFYTFTNLAPGNYYLYFGNLPQGFVFSPQGQGSDPALDSDANSQGATAVFTLTPGSYRSDLDAGINNPNAQPPMLQARVLLEGAYEPATGLMRSDLNVQNLLPLNQPYQAAPWGYNGTQGVNAIPATGIVDWLLIDFRDATDPTQILGYVVALVTGNGDVVDLDGTSQVVVPALDHVGSAYIALHHRNHLSVMTAAPVVKTTHGFVFDFSAGLNVLYHNMQVGNAPARELSAGGTTMMLLGDTNGDELINSLDLGTIMQEYFSAGLLQEDVNLDGVTNSLDIGRTMQNYFKRSHVPE